jgi:hypothetical protein
MCITFFAWAFADVARRDLDAQPVSVCQHDFTMSRAIDHEHELLKFVCPAGHQHLPVGT